MIKQLIIFVEGESRLHCDQLLQEAASDLLGQTIEHNPAGEWESMSVSFSRVNPSGITVGQEAFVFMPVDNTEKPAESGSMRRRREVESNAES